MVIWSFIRSFIRKERMRGRQMPVRGSMSRTGTLYHPTVLTAIPDIRVQTRTASRMVVRQRPVQPAMAATQCREIPMAATRIRQCLEQAPLTPAALADLIPAEKDLLAETLRQMTDDQQIFTHNGMLQIRK